MKSIISKVTLVVFALVLVYITNSCATVVHGNKSVVTIESTNSITPNSTGATYKIFTEDGELLREGKCPELVELKAGGSILNDLFITSRLNNKDLIQSIIY